MDGSELMDGSDLITAQAGYMDLGSLTYLYYLLILSFLPYFPGGLFHLPGSGENKRKQA
nr:hypothetical protein Q903MT_gene2806 [Picea sitchensis]